MRAFVAIDLPEALADRLEEIQAGLPGRHVPRDNLHLTLAFLGEVDSATLARTAEALAELRLAPPVLRVSGLDIPGGRKPALVFAAVAPDPALDSARAAVRRACRAAGIDLRRERFRPHVTLARFTRKPTARDAAGLAGRLGVIEAPAVMAERFSLVRSELREDGARYSALATFGFAGPVST